MDFAAMFVKLITKNGLVAAFIIIGITTWIAYKIGGLTKGRIHGSAIAIFFGLILAYIGGVVGGGHKGLASIPMFAGVGVMGGAMFRDFAIVSTAFGADLRDGHSSPHIRRSPVRSVCASTAFAAHSLSAER